MHGLDKALLHPGEFDVGLVATLALHLCGDAANDDDGVGTLHLIGEGTVFHEVTFADITPEHGKVAVAAFVFDDHVVGLALLHVERLIFHIPTEEATPLSAGLGFLYHLAIYLEHIAIVGHEGVFHLAGESGLVLAGDAHREVVFVDALGKSPSAERREVELVVVVGLHGVSLKILVVVELHEDTLAIVEILQVMHRGILVGQFASLMVDDTCTGHGSLDALEERVGVRLGGRAAIVSVEHRGVVGIRTYDGDGAQLLRQRQSASVLEQHHRLPGCLGGEGIV